MVCSRPLQTVVQDSYKQLYKTLTNSCSRLLQTVVRDRYKQLYETVTNSCTRPWKHPRKEGGPKQACLSADRFEKTEAIFYLLKTNLLRFQTEKNKKM